MDAVCVSVAGYGWQRAGTGGGGRGGGRWMPCKENYGLRVRRAIDGV